MRPPRTGCGSRQVPLRSFVRVLTIAFTLVAVGLALLVRGTPLTGRSILVVAGPSMVPAICVGSAIVVEPIEPAHLAVGDIVSLKVGPSRAVFTHRIVRLIYRDGALWLETKGDANATPDPSIVPASDVLGRVAVVIPWAGYLVALASHPSGLVLLVALGLLLLVAAWILDSKQSTGLALQPV